MTPPARRVLDQALTEDQWAATLIGTDQTPGLARTLGWTCLHHHDSRREVTETRPDGCKVRRLVGDTDAAGLPDWLLLRERIVWVELKAQGKGPTPVQREVLRLIFAAGGEAYLWRPGDYAEAQRVLLTHDAPPKPYRWDVSYPNLQRAGVLPRTTQRVDSKGRT
jgi:hypothetical protein